MNPLGRLRESSALRFNYANRDAWVTRHARAIPQGATVLDVGAGTCPYADALSHTEYRTHDFAALDTSMNRAGVNYGRIDYVSDVLNIPVPDASFDVILCTEVLEHVPDPVGALRECGRILKPGGTLLLTAPLGSGLHQEPFHYYGGFTPYWYDEFLPRAGFDISELTPNGDSFMHYGQMGQHVVGRLAPWRIGGIRGFLWAPFWVLLAPLLGVAIPLLAHRARILANDQKFVVGYFVKAKKRFSSSTTDSWSDEDGGRIRATRNP